MLKVQNFFFLRKEKYKLKQYRRKAAEQEQGNLT